MKDEIEKVLVDNQIPYTREHRLDNKNILDFFVYGIGIEVKIKGSAKITYQQCERYCQFDEVKKLLLITNKAHGMPLVIRNKQIYVLRLGNAWL